MYVHITFVLCTW